MKDALLSCVCDRVVEMEEMGISAREILQYARAFLSRREVSTLLVGLERAVSYEPWADPFQGGFASRGEEVVS